MKEAMEILTVNGIQLEPHKNYPHEYPAAQCRKTGLPMYTGWKARQKHPGGELFSRTQRKNAKHPVRQGEQPAAWYRTNNGYVPLYEGWKETD